MDLPKRVYISKHLLKCKFILRGVMIHLIIEMSEEIALVCVVEVL